MLGCTTARQSIKDAIRGALKTDDDRTSAEAALWTLAVYPYPESEDLLFAALTNPLALRVPEKPAADAHGEPIPGQVAPPPSSSSPYMSSSNPYMSGTNRGPITITAAELQTL